MIKHKFNIFPEMHSDDYKRLTDDLRLNGFDSKQPVYTFQGAILDGWNRTKACKELGIQPIFAEFQGTDTEALDFVLRTNKRRNLTSSQWAAIAAEADEIIVAIAEQVERDRTAKISRNNGNSTTTQLIVESPEEPLHNKLCNNNRSENETAQKVANLFNTNRTYINDAKNLKENNPELFQDLKSGKKTITEIKKEEKKAERKENLLAQQAAINAGEIEMPAGVFEVIVIDPPWNYGTEYDPDGRRVANPYPEMSTEEIAKMELPAADDCILWLWTTHRFMRDAYKLLDAWGFQEKMILTWVKNKMGCGSWLRSKSEFCIMAAKGNPKVNLTNQTTVLNADTREHSRKPDEFYTMVDTLCIGRKLDYFSRETREGWCQYGNDSNKF